MNKKLIVSSSEKGQELLLTLLKSHDTTLATAAHNAGEARRLLIQHDFELVIIATPLSDEFGSDLATYIADNSQAGVILIVKQDIAEQVAAKVEDFGVIVVPAPLSKVLFFQSIKMVNIMRRRMLKLQNENVKLRAKLSDTKVINRAKCILIQHLNITEEEAHKQIEKQAMDRQMTRKAIAENVIDNYE